ncbi:hypothetical protein AAFN85_00640 [Mucilaginibacter sp. CAU 1740]|uniref:hypothetical protein n=1 Tax=Mucilaginibacter sp. CAU 1740 TaxID=3140365 RepID=UPI00325B3DCE
MTCGKFVFTQLKTDTMRWRQVLNASKALAIKLSRPSAIDYITNAIHENNEIMELIEEQLASISREGQDCQPDKLALQPPPKFEATPILV